MKTLTTQGIRLALAAFTPGCPSLQAAKPGGGGTTATHAITHLGTLGGNYSFAYGINAAGQVVGPSLSLPRGWRNLSGFVPLDSTAFLWQNGTLKSLYSLLLNPTGWNRTDRATAINDSGWITGSGLFNNNNARSWSGCAS